MKRFMSLMVAMVAVLMISSCVKDEYAKGDEATMTLSVELPDAGVTKAFGDGMFAKKNLIIGVFDENRTEKFRQVVPFNADEFKKTITIRFVMGKTYQMVFWAQYEGAPYGNPEEMELNTITLDYSASNRENVDAFYAYEPLFTVKKDFQKSIVLKRPFAQVNFATTVNDMDESVLDDLLDLSSKAIVTVSKVCNTLDLFTGETYYVDENQKADAAGATVTVPATEFPKDKDGKYPTIQVENVTYELVAMNYFLVADAQAEAGKTTVDLSLKVGELEISVPCAHMKRNWRTNVIGELLTGEGTFEVKIDQEFEGTCNENWNENQENTPVVPNTPTN